MKRLILFAFFLLSVFPAVAGAQSDASIKIVKPGDRHNVELGEVAVDVEVSIAGAPQGYTWQILIDGDPQGMVRKTTTTTIKIPSPSGPHRLKAELYDEQGRVLATNEILVLAAPVENHDPVFNRAWFAPLMGVFTLLIIGIIVLGLRLRPRTAA